MSESVWRSIVGYPNYEVSYFGKVRRVTNTKKGFRMLTPYEKKPKKGSRYLVIGLNKDGKKREFKVSQLVYEAFGGKIPEGYRVVHKDGCFDENIFSNLVLMDKSELGKMTGHKAKRKPVAKLTADLVPVEIYRSARQAAKENYMSYQTVIDRCNGKIKSLLAPDGFVYKWDEDVVYEEVAA